MKIAPVLSQLAARDDRWFRPYQPEARRELRAMLAVVREARKLPHSSVCLAYVYPGTRTERPEPDLALCDCWRRSLARLEKVSKKGEP